LVDVPFRSLCHISTKDYTGFLARVVLSHFRAAPSGQVIIEDLAADLDDVETNYASIKALRKAATEFQTYIENNASTIPNYAERRRYGERVSTSFVESTVNTVVEKRFGNPRSAQMDRLVPDFALLA
jgi:hypothetical protein